MDKYQSLFDADDTPKRDDKKNEQLAISNEELTQEEPKPEPTPEPEPETVLSRNSQLATRNSEPTPEPEPAKPNSEFRIPNSELNESRNSQLATRNSSYPAEPIPALTGKTVWVLDSHAILYQVFHAIPEMTTPDGQAINAVYGMTRDLLALMETHRPDYLLAAFDLPAPTVRHKRYDQYKANRKEMPVDLQSQIAKSHELLDACAIPGLQFEGYEADDILATVAQTVELAGGQCVLVTADKDSRQLLSDKVQIYLIRKNKFYTESDLMTDWGVTPQQAIDFQAMVGDASDNVPGIPKIGPKTATALLQQFGTLEEMLKHTDQIKAKGTRQNVEQNVENARLSKELVTLHTNVPINIPWTAAQCRGPKESEIIALMKKWGFRSLIGKAAKVCESYRDMEYYESVAPDPNADEYDDAQADFSDLSQLVPSEQKVQIQTQLIDSPAALDALADQLSKAPMIALAAFGDAPGVNSDVPAREQTLIGLALATTENVGYYLPFNAAQTQLLEQKSAVLDMDAALKRLQPILESADKLFVGHDIKRIRTLLRNQGVQLQGTTFDVMIADALAAPGELSHALTSLAQRWFEYVPIDLSEKLVVREAKSRRILALNELSVETVAPYAVEQAVLPIIAYRYLLPELENVNQLKLAQELEFPLERVLADMEYTGVKVNLETLAALSKTYTDKLSVLQSEIYQLAGEEFNIDSPRQVQTILFDKLGLPKQRRTQTGSSVDADVLQTLSERHPIAAKILEYRTLAKLKSTYTDALPELVYSKTQRIHCSFNQTVTATGRLSSTHPNLQNIPIRGKEGREIRRAFVPGFEGWKLLDADYSQIELRVLAHVCQDKALIQAFQDGLDIHAQVAAEILGIPLEEVTSEQRSSAKAVNFGIIYGQSSFGLAKSLGIPQPEAAAFIDAYFARFPAIHDFLDSTLYSASQNGYVETLWGRRRYLEGVRNAHTGQLNATERMAINTVIQGTAADIIKAAMISVFDKLNAGGYKSKLLIQIHDELLLECPPEEVEDVKTLLVSTMENVFPMRVPLKVDANVGDNWSEAH